MEVPPRIKTSMKEIHLFLPAAPKLDDAADGMPHQRDQETDEEQRLADFEDIEAYKEKEVAEIGRPHVSSNRRLTFPGSAAKSPHFCLREKIIGLSEG